MDDAALKFAGESLNLNRTGTFPVSVNKAVFAR